MDDGPNPLEFSIIGDKPPECVHLVVAETGISCDYELHRLLGRDVSVLQTIIENELEIPKNNQILLKDDGTQLDPSMSLNQILYSNTTIFIFNAENYTKKAEAADENTGLNHIYLQKTWSESTHNYAYAMYENIFGDEFRKYIDDKGKAYFDRITECYTDCKDFVKQSKELLQMVSRQSQAELSAKNNLKQYYEEKVKIFSETIEKSSERLKEITPITENLAPLIKKLKEVEVSPLFAKEGKKVLFDYFDEKKVTDLSQVCKKNQQKILQKLSIYKEETYNYKLRIEHLKDNITESMEQLQDVVKKQEHEAMDLFDNHFAEFREMVDQTAGRLSKDKINEFGKTQSEMIGKMVKEMQPKFTEILKKIEAEILQNKTKIKEFIREISKIQTEIRDGISLKVKNFNTLIDKHKKHTSYIEILEKFPRTYESCLDELKRRGEFKKNYSRVLEALAKYAGYENEFREKFMRDNGANIPSSFCPFLANKFPKLNVEQIMSHIEEDFPIEPMADKGESDENDKILEFAIMFEKQHKLIENKTAECKRLEEGLKALKQTLEQNPETSLVGALSAQMKMYEQNFSYLIKDRLASTFVGKIEQKLAAYQKKMEKLESKVRSCKIRAGSGGQKQSDEVPALRKTIEEYKQQLTQAEHQIKAFQLSINSLATKNDELKAQLAKKDPHEGSNHSEPVGAADSQKSGGLAKECEDLKAKLLNANEENALLKTKLADALDDYQKQTSLLREAEKITTEVYSFFVAKLPLSKQEEFWTKEFSPNTIKEMYEVVMTESIQFKEGDRVKIVSPEPKDQVLFKKTDHNHYAALVQHESVKIKFLLGKEGKLYIEKDPNAAPIKLATIKSIDYFKEKEAYEAYKLKPEEVLVCLIEVEEIKNFDLC